MANAVAALFTSLTLEAAGFISNSKKAADATDVMASKISKSLTISKGAVDDFINALGVGISIATVAKALDYAASIGEVSQQLGVATKSYQELSYAATQVGVSQQELETGLARLTRNIGTGAEVFAQLGIAIRDTAGNSRSTSDVFNDVADKLRKIEDPAKRAAIEVAIFGKTGQKLDTMLSGGTEALGAMADEARRLGMVLSDKQIRDADNAADAFGRVKKTLEVSIAGAVADNAHAIEGMADALGKLFAQAGKVASWAQENPKLAGVLLGGAAGARFGGPMGAGVGMVGGFFGGAEIESQANKGFRGTRGQGKKPVAPISEGVPYDPKSDKAALRAAASAEKTAARLAAAADKKAATAAAKSAAALDWESMTKIGPSIVGFSDDVTASMDKLANGASMDAILDKMFTVSNTFEGITKATDSFAESLKNPAFEKFGESLTSNLATALVYGQNIGDALVNSFKAAAAEAIASGLFKILTGAIGGGFGGIGASIAGIFGGARANGGPVSSGKSYLVGERGPEILTGASGRIIPNHALGGGSGDGMTVNVDARGSNDPAAVRAQVMLGIAQAAPALVAAARGDTISTLRRPSLAGGRG